MMPNIQMNKNLSMTYQKMLEISIMLITLTNKEMFFQQATNMTHKVKLTSKMLLCNQETERTQLCSLKVNKDTSFQKMLRTYQTSTMITNKEMFSPLDINMVLKVKHISKITQCNQEMESIQLCSLKINTSFQRMLKTYLTLTTITNKEMFSQQVTSMIHKAKPISRITQCNQEMENIQ